MGENRRIALLFEQFAAYHVDRCEAVARRFAGRGEVIAVEVATTSITYAWEPSGEVAGARKLTLFSGENYELIAWPRRLWRMLRVLWRCDVVLVGIGYNQPDIIVLSWLLSLVGVRVVLLSESKFDDRPRKSWFEALKALILLPYHAAIVGAQRQASYFRFLGFRRRPVLPGYDTVGIERIRRMGGGVVAPAGPAHGERDFVFVGRFVEKKNLEGLIDAFALYVRKAGAAARRLVLVGSGEAEASIRDRARGHGVEGLVVFPGFLGAEQVAAMLAGGLALILPSIEEQWGLVVNEALAFGLPAIVSSAVGSGDVLVRNLVNGFVIEHGNVEGMALAMAALAGDEGLWRRMTAASLERAWLGDAERLADACEVLLSPEAKEAADNLARFEAEMACPRPS